MCVCVCVFSGPLCKGTLFPVCVCVCVCVCFLWSSLQRYIVSCALTVARASQSDRHWSTLGRKSSSMLRRP